jgi:ATP phosphoribosyltransferase
VSVEEISLVSARLIVNPAALRLKRETLRPLIDTVAAAAAAARARRLEAAHG